MATTEATEQEDLWGVTRTAQYLDVSPSWVYLHTDSGDLPFLRVGAQKKFVPSVVRAWARGEVKGSGRLLKLGRDIDGEGERS